MRIWPQIMLIVLLSISAQASGQTAQQQLDQIRLQQQFERIQAETDRVRAETDRMRLEAERMAAEAAIDEKRQRLAEEEEERAEAARKAEEAADDLRDEMSAAAVRSSDNMYLAIAISLTAIAGFLIAKRSTKGEPMNYDQKFGITLMTASALLSILAIVVSDNWSARLDILQNVVLLLHVRLIPEGATVFGPSDYAIDVPTKFVLTALLAAIAYGFTTYLGISPAWKPGAKAAAITAPTES